MNNKLIKLIGLGAGGHVRGIIEILREQRLYELIGLLDSRSELKGSDVLGVPVLGDDCLLPSLKREGIDRFFIGLGGVKFTAPRRRLFELALRHGLGPVDVIHPNSVISPSAVLGEGITIMAGAIINACARLGKNVIVNTGAIVEHDCRIGDHVHIAIGSQLASTVKVEDGAHIGAGATVLQSLRIEENAVVGAGAVVIRDVPPAVTVVGCPARILR